MTSALLSLSALLTASALAAPAAGAAPHNDHPAGCSRRLGEGGRS